MTLDALDIEQSTSPRTPSVLSHSVCYHGFPAGGGTLPHPRNLTARRTDLPLFLMGRQRGFFPNETTGR